jgi:trimeric autotransporter adhesin
MFICKKKYVSLVVVMILIISHILINSHILKASSGEVSLILSAEKLKVNEEFNIAVRVKGIKDIHGASLELNFDKSLIEILSIAPGSLYNGLTEGTNYRHFSSFDRTDSGTISTAILLTGLDNGISAEGTLFILRAKALSAGTVTLKPDINYKVKLANSSKTVHNKITSYIASESVLNIINDTEWFVTEKLEQASPRIAFTGIWYNHWEARNSGGSARYSNDKTASFSFSFDGTGFRWYGLANRFKGKAKITIDGETEIVDTFWSSEHYQKLFYEKNNLQNGRHEVRVEVLTDYLNIDYIEILSDKANSTPAVVPTAPLSPTPSPGPSQPTDGNNNPGNTSASIKKLEQTDISIRYIGHWLNHWENRNSGGSAKFTNVEDAAFEFTFEGTGFRWYGLANKFKGKCKITVNGKSEIVDTYHATEQYQKLFYSKEGLSNGKHTVRIETLTDYINIDFLEIVLQSQPEVNPPSSQPVNPISGKWTRFEEDDKAIKYNGTWLTHNHSSNSGNTARFTDFRNASAEFTFTGTGFRWYGNANKFKGPVTVTVDGKNERVNTYFDGQQYQKLFYEKRNLNYGTYTVKLSLVYDYISIDCLDIENGTLNQR